MIKAVIFDLDGTLADTLADLADSCNFALSSCGFPNHPLEKYKYFVGNGIPKLTEKIIPEDKLNEENHKRVYTAFLNRYSEHYVDKTVPYDGILTTLNSLKESGCKIAVVSNKAQEMCEKVINKLFGNIFDAVVGKREDYPAKPDPTLTLNTVASLKVNPDECVFIGDSGVDMKTATNSGIKSIGVLWGFRTKEELLENNANYLAAFPEEIIDIIKEINNEA